MVDTVADLEFPIWGLLPKQETGITSFLNKYPEYDGRKINIAIFDSGVDPGAPGLQLTSTGERKIIARFDCSGCGDVNTSATVQPNEEGFITGLTGRKLKIPDAWLKTNKEFHIGVKNAYELYPSKLKERIETERKEKLWDARHKVVTADATRNLQKLENSSPKKNNHLSDADILLKEEHEYRVEFLNNLEKKYLDLGPVYDCVVFQEGDLWKACIDTTEEGDLSNGILLAEYSKTFEFAPLTKADQLNISINVHDNGNVLEIVGLCSGHGTHVASIASAYFPNNPEKNGAAPGSQIISLTVGDGRLGSMETGTALVRAMIKVMELSKTDHPVHVINMSYGEHANWSNAGRIGDLMNEVVNKYGVVWVASAGNHGPALCTVGTPPDISQNTLIGVGAYVSPEMMVAEYSLRQKLPGMAYTWTSRGPTIDGDIGISICAPGAAITSVPNFTLRNAQLLNGTSMSAPHVGGAICILLSGLIQQNIAYSPYNVKRALENSARYLEHVDPFAQGHGLLQVEKAFEYLTNFHTCPATNVRFAVLCGHNGAKGIHLRKPANQPIEYTVNIEPCFKDCEEIDPETKIKFGLHLALVSKSSYVQCPAFLDLQNLGRAINVKIDPAGLVSGVHHTEIEAFDVSCVEKGPLFRVPITIIQPDSFEPSSNMEMHFKDVIFKPNTIKRHFIQVPENATWGILRLRCTENGKQGRFVVHCMQILPKQSCKAQEFQKMSQVTSHSDTIFAFQVKGGLILEVVVAKYWANLGDVVMDYSLIMHGIKPDCPSITMQAVDGLYEMEIRCLRMEEIAPIITLKSSVQALKPTDSKVSPLTARDIIPEGRQIYELVLTYEFHISKATEVVPNSPLLSDVLYESEFESQLWMLFDSNKQMLSCGDAYASKYIVKLERGDYVIKLHVRHDKKDLLEKLNDIPMLLSRKLSNSLSLDVYCNYAQAIIQGKKMISASVMKGATLPIYISPMFSDKSKLSSIQGQYLSGTITYAKDEYGKKVDTYPFKFIPSDPPKKSSSSSTKTEKEKTKLEEYLESLRDLKTSYLAKLEYSDQATTVYEEIKTAYPDHLAVHNAMMQCVDPIDVKKHLPLFDESQIQEQNKVTYNKIISLADIVINAVDIDKMLSMLAIKSDQRTDAAKIRTATEKQKAALLDALARKGIALCRLYLMDKNATTAEEMLDSIKSIWKDILKFIDPSDLKASVGNILYFAMWHAAVLQHYGRVLKYLGKLLEEKTQREIEEKCAEVCTILGWDHCVRYINKSLPIKYPANYRPF